MLIKIGNILLDLNDISSISKTHCSDPTYRGSYNIQIVYKSSIVKNFKSDEIGLDYDTFINTVLKLQEKQNDDHLLRLMIISQSINK